MAAAMAPPVGTMAVAGVPVRSWRRAREGGRSPSRAMAIGIRLEAMMPAFPAVTKEERAAADITARPAGPAASCAPRMTGLRSPDIASPSTPTVAPTART